jgi:nucleotide-binding universal stress UspA family protein
MLSILAMARGAVDDGCALAAAADLARRHGGHVSVVNIFANPIMTAAATGPISPSALRSLVEQDDEVRAAIAVQVKRQAEKFTLQTCPGVAGGSISIAQRASTVWGSLQQALPLADMVVVAQSAACGLGAWTGALGEALMEARAAVYVARGEDTAAGRAAAIAWDGSLEAGRAVRAALPLLRDASSVAILQDPDDVDVASGGPGDPERLRRYLLSSGIAAGSTVEARGRKVGLALLKSARELGAALLVAGAFGHSRLGEALFGGATRSMLEAGAGPHLLLSH